jgi:hypothetical protein
MLIKGKGEKYLLWKKVEFYSMFEHIKNSLEQ